MVWRWAKCCVHHCTCGTSCQGHLPGDIAGRVCFMVWGVDLVTVPSCLRLWGVRVLCPEDKKTGRSSSGLLSSLSRCNRWRWWVAGPKGPVVSCWISLGLPYPKFSWGQVGRREMTELTANRTCSLKAELCLFLLYDLSFGEGFGSPSVAENLDDDARGRRQRVALSAMTWAGSIPQAWGIKQISQDHPADWEGKETNGNSVPGTVTHTFSLDSLQPCDMSIFPLQCENRSSERENCPKLSRL